MGLDLYLIKKTDYENKNFTDETELAYGRKTWAIANELQQGATEIESECVYDITKQSYMNLCMKALPYKEYLKVINETVNETELDEQTAEYIFNMVFDTGSLPQLGYVWECSALYNWAFTDQEKILKAFDEDKVYMVMSY